MPTGSFPRRWATAFGFALAVVGAAPAEGAVGAQGGEVRSWMYDARGSRHNGDETAIRPATVKRLRLRWAFAVPKATGQSSQPAVANGTIYFGGRNGAFYARSARTGRKRWTLDTRPLTPKTAASPTNALRNGPAVAGGRVFFGDSRGQLYGVDARTGKVLWITDLSDHPNATITSSPVVHEGKVLVGVASNEEALAAAPTYPCCSFRGSFVAVAAATGQLLWRHWTTAEPQFAGFNDAGAPRLEPSGVAVWASPAVDPATDTVFFGTGDDYSGSTGSSDSVVALDANTGAVRWSRQLTAMDTWNFQCLVAPGVGNCPRPGPDFDIGAQANVFAVGGRTVVGIGQKSGFYHVLDATTGDLVWQRQLSAASGDPRQAGFEGIQWGGSYDGSRLYVSTNRAKPGTLFALDAAKGDLVWRRPVPSNACKTGGAARRAPEMCLPALPSPVSSSPGLVWQGGFDGKLRAHSAATGKILWTYDTVRRYRTVNRVPGTGGSIEHGGVVVSNGMVYTPSGYQSLGVPLTAIGGNVILAFGLE